MTKKTDKNTTAKKKVSSRKRASKTGSRRSAVDAAVERITSPRKKKRKTTVRKAKKAVRKKTKKKTAVVDAVEILHRRFIGDDPERLAELEQARVGARVAQQIHDLRTNAGLTQAELAKRVKTSRTVISRLEDNDYDGHSLSMLQRIATALGLHVEVRFVSPSRPPVSS